MAQDEAGPPCPAAPQGEAGPPTPNGPAPPPPPSAAAQGEAGPPPRLGIGSHFGCQRYLNYYF